MNARLDLLVPLPAAGSTVIPPTVNCCARLAPAIDVPPRIVSDPALLAETGGRRLLRAARLALAGAAIARQ